MILFRTIVTNNRQDFDAKIRQNLNEGYRMINSNLCIERPIQAVNTLKHLDKIIQEKPINTYYDLIFYAYMEKEVN